MLEIRDFSKTYKGGKRAVDHLSLRVEPGSIVGFIGPNGAGKTTTIRAVVGVLDFDEGDILIGGHSVRREPIECKKLLAYVPDNPDLYDYLTGMQYLNFMADVFGVSAKAREARIREYGELFGLTINLGDSIGSFSTKTQELFTSWQNGGATQKEVIDSIVADIGNCTNQQEALNLAALAFGTMAEDGNLKFITSLTSVGSIYDSVKGSAQGMFDATTTPMQEMEANTRKLQQALVPLGEKLAELANAILPPLVAVVSAISGWFEKLPGPVQNFVLILGALLVAFTTLTPVIAAMSVAVGALNISLLPIIGIIAAVAAAIAGIIAIVQNWGAITEWFGNLWATVCNGIGQMVESLKRWFSGLWTHLQGVWDGICNVVQTAVMLLGSILQAAFDIITLPFRLWVS